MRLFAKGLAFLLASLITIISVAQDTCPLIVETALERLDAACETIGRNEACYGNGNITAIDPTGEELGDFTSAGDIADLLDIASLTLSGLDEDDGLWGVAILSVQANIPNTLPGQNLTMLMFGDSELQTVEDDSSAFIFSTGIGQLGCQEAPNGLLIQTPEGAGTINLSVNNVAIELGSTAYLTAEADGEFSFALLEGHAILSGDESEVEIAAGEFSTVALDEEFNPVGDFSPAETIEGNLELPELPLSALPRDISGEEGEEIANNGEFITPRLGNWAFETTVMDASAACPAMMQAAMEMGANENGNLFVNFGGEGWEFETFYREATLESTGMEPLHGTYTSPETNIYVYETAGGGDMAPFVFTLEIVSETELLGSYFIDASEMVSGCTIEVEFQATWSE